jgi:hypothetical protein
MIFCFLDCNALIENIDEGVFIYGYESPIFFT